ncbi:MAG: hypothetical protein ACOX5J_17530 [Candidatus Hydrogenedentales bacterium]
MRPLSLILWNAALAGSAAHTIHFVSASEAGGAFLLRSRLVRAVGPIAGRWTRRAVGAIVLIFASTTAYAITKEQVAEVFEDKLVHMQTLHVEYLHEMKIHEAGKPVATKQWANEWFWKGGKRAVNQTFVDMQSDTMKRTYQTVSRDGVRVKLRFLREDVDPQAAIYGAEASDDIFLGAATPMGYSGLYPATDPGNHNFGNCNIPVLMRLESSRILEVNAELNGENCVLVEWGSEDVPMGRWWLSSEKNLAVVKYEGYSGPKDARFTRMVNTMSDFSEHAPGLFLPQTIATHEFELGDLGERQTASIQTFTLLKVELNPEISDEVFELELPAGTVVKDDIIGDVYVVESRASLGSLVEAAGDDLVKISQELQSRSAEREVQDPSPAVRAVMAASGQIETRRGRQRHLFFGVLVGAACLSALGFYLGSRRPI